MISQLKSSVRQLFYRSSLFQGVVGIASVLTGRTSGARMSHLLAYREDDAIGPLQRDEAIALFGIVRTLRPRVVVEFGFFHGHSAFNFLQALEQDALLFSYDIDGDSRKRAETEFTFDRRFRFLAKSQTDFDAADIGNREIDFVFFDAAHELHLNQETFRKIAPHLAPEAMMAVHDTGVWNRTHLAPIHETFTREMPGEWLDEETYAHQPGERAFIDWIISTYPEFTALHFHSTRTLRHGFTLLQKKRVLSSS
ncbi:MAG: class I SAM-dependent methyltransferase [Verrucomicrobiaceae bacterium]|nr:MAG: class I SAM-dependent methyltransferase [Verrucomicrobiaceae bacterium]